jgi:hypothetical protein
MLCPGRAGPKTGWCWELFVHYMAKSSIAVGAKVKPIYLLFGMLLNPKPQTQTPSLPLMPT